MSRPDPLQPPHGWHRLEQPRLTPPPPAERGLFFRSLSLLAKRFGRSEVPTLFPVLNIHRGLFLAWLWFASRLMPYGRLQGPVRELLILRTAWNCRCRYEWGQHVELGLRAGLRDADILLTTHASLTEPSLTTPTTEKHLLLQACDELCQQDMLSDTTWATLQSRHNDADIIEIMLLVGHYRMLAGFLNSAGLELEDAVERCVQDFWQRTAATRAEKSR